MCLNATRGHQPCWDIFALHQIYPNMVDTDVLLVLLHSFSIHVIAGYG